MYNKDQVGCGYCIYEKTCMKRDPQINKAKQGCGDYTHHNADKGAVLSDCYRYRYSLWRTWDQHLPKVLFIMLNPSTADAYINDSTVRRCIGFAKSWGYGGIMIGNLNPLISTDPKALKKIDRNATFLRHSNISMQHINKMAAIADKVILAWGAGAATEDANPFWKLPKVHHLGLTKQLHPKHPLYLSKNIIPISV